MPRIKVNKEAIANIKEMRKNGVHIKDIAAKYDISTASVYQMVEGVKPPKKESGICQYCGCKVKSGYRCGACSEKIKLVREIHAIGKVILKLAEEERMQRDGC